MCSARVEFAVDATVEAVADRPAQRRTDRSCGGEFGVWGSTYVAIRVVVESVPPLAAAGVRFLTAGILLGAFLTARGANERWRIPRRKCGRSPASVS
jgi:EamA-like transporter family protein